MKNFFINIVFFIIFNTFITIADEITSIENKLQEKIIQEKNIEILKQIKNDDKLKNQKQIKFSSLSLNEEPLENIDFKENNYKNPNTDNTQQNVTKIKKQKNDFIETIENPNDDKDFKKKKTISIQEKICVSCGTIFILNYILNLINPSISFDENKVVNILFPIDKLKDINDLKKEYNFNKEYVLKEMPDSKFNASIIENIKQDKIVQDFDVHFLNPFLEELMIAAKKTNLKELYDTKIFYKINNIVESITIENLLETKTINYKFICFISEYYLNIQDAFSANIMNILSKTIRNNSENNPIEYKNIILFNQMNYWQKIKYKIISIFHWRNFKFYIF